MKSISNEEETKSQKRQELIYIFRQVVKFQEKLFEIMENISNDFNNKEKMPSYIEDFEEISNILKLQYLCISILCKNEYYNN